MNEIPSDKTQQLEAFATAKSLLKETLNEKYLKSYIDIPQQSITTGFFAIDNITKGFKNGELVTIAVRPGIGKTSFLLSMINNIALCEGHAVGIFSTERKGSQLIKRLVQSTTGVSLDKINQSELSDIQNNHVKAVVNSIINSNIIINDQGGISSQTIIEKAVVMKENGAEIIFIDYLELLHSNNTQGDNEDEDMLNVVQELNQLAKSLNIPIILFSQLSKPVIYNNKYKYTPDYVNENTDTLIFLNRPSYYHINAIDKVADDKAEITIAKNINIGEMQVANLRIIESLSQFKDLN